MKLLPQQWPNSPDAKALGFFAQALLELVHDESWESYKLPSLAVPSRLIELRKVARAVMRNSLPAKVLEPMLEEIDEAFHHDSVVAEILKRKGLSSEDLRLSATDKADDIYLQAGFILSILDGEYRTVAERLIIEECFEKQRRSEIYALTKSLFSELIIYGHSRKSVEAAVRMSFFNKVPPVTRKSLSSFFALFPSEDLSFVVYGVANPAHIAEVGVVSGCEVLSAKAVPSRVKKLIAADSGKAYFRMDSPARDVFSAAYRSGKMMSAGEAFLSLFPGEMKGTVPEAFAVTRMRSSVCEIAEAKPTIRRRILSRSRKSTLVHMQRVARLITGPKKPDELVGAHLINAVLTASLAERSSAPAIRLLTLWAAFEALLPHVPDGSGNRISHFLDYIIPAVTVSYARDCFIEFSRDADRLHSTEYRAALSSIPVEGTLVDKLAAVVINGSDDQKRTLLRVFSCNPIALYKLKHLEDSFASPEAFERKLSAHTKRVTWQVQRIYRERNTVMHNGESSPFIEQLLSNIQYYYEAMFANLERAAAGYGSLPVSYALAALKKQKQIEKNRVIQSKRLQQKEPVRSQMLLLEVVTGRWGGI